MGVMGYNGCVRSGFTSESVAIDQIMLTLTVGEEVAECLNTQGWFLRKKYHTQT